MPATFSSICSLESSSRSFGLPLGSPIMPGAAADDRDRPVPEPLQTRERHHGQQRADVKARRRRIEADVRPSRESFANRSGQALRSRRRPARATSALRRDCSYDVGDASVAEPSRITIAVDGHQPPQRAEERCSPPASESSPAGAPTGFSTGAMPSSSRERSCRCLDCRPHWPDLRIGLITDVHRSQWVSAEDVQRAVRLLMSAKPDLVVLGGDFVTWGDRKFVGPSAEALSALNAPHGVFAILGNHDDDHDMPAALSAGGAEVLRDARTKLRIRNEVAGACRAPLLDQTRLRHQRHRAWRLRSGHPARPRSATPDRSRRAADSSGAVRSHPRRAGRAARHRSRRGEKISGHRGNRADRTTRPSSSAGASARCTCRSGSIARQKSRC